MVPKKTEDAPPVDPRSLQTDHTKYMPRSLHAVKCVVGTAIYISEVEKITAPRELARRAMKVLRMARTDFDPDVCPTMATVVKQIKLALDTK